MMFNVANPTEWTSIVVVARGHHVTPLFQLYGLCQVTSSDICQRHLLRHPETSSKVCCLCDSSECAATSDGDRLQWADEDVWTRLGPAELEMLTVSLRFGQTDVQKSETTGDICRDTPKLPA